jgi:hypothetical protein
MQDEQSRSRADDILSQIDIMLPSQYFATVGSSGLSGEQRLMLAVLIDAINVLQSWKGTGSPRKRHNFAEAVQWVNTRGTHHPFSFDSVCDALELDRQVLRSRLHGLTARPANSARRPALGHLRIKELSRRQQMTANRPRRRERVPRGLTGSTEITPESSTRCELQTELEQDCTDETSGGLAALGNLSTDRAIGDSVSW